MAKFKVGDKVKFLNSGDGDYEQGFNQMQIEHGYTPDPEDTGVIVAINDSIKRYLIKFSTNRNNDKIMCLSFHEHTLQLIKSNPIINSMTLMDKFAMLMKGEPEKSLFKAGITNKDYTLTEEGHEVFMQWLLKKFGADFKTEVVDKLLEAEKEK